MYIIIPGKYPEEWNWRPWLIAEDGADLENLHPVFRARLAAYARDVIKEPLKIGSGARSAAEQIRLYNLYLSGNGNLASAPGTSWHEYRLAIDCNRLRTVGNNIGIYQGTINADFDLWLAGKPETLNKYGLMHAVKTERWHIQPIETQGYTGDRSKFLDEEDVMKKGDRGAAVGAWQRALLKCKYKMINAKGVECTADDDFGGGTENGTKLFQADEGLPQTGEVDELTYGRMLDRLMKNNGAESQELCANFMEKSNEVIALSQTVKDRDAALAAMSAENLTLKNTVKNRNSEIETLQKEIIVTAERTDADLKEKADQIAELESDLTETKKEHSLCAGDIKELTNQIDRLKSENAELSGKADQAAASTVNSATVGALLSAIIAKLKPTIKAFWESIKAIK